MAKKNTEKLDANQTAHRVFEIFLERTQKESNELVKTEKSETVNIKKTTSVKKAK